MLKFKNLLTMLIAFMAAASAWAFDSVTSLPKGQDTKTSYMLMTARGALYADPTVEPDRLTSNCQTGRHASVKADAADPRFQFLLFKATGQEDGYYVYSVKMQQFIGQSGMNAIYNSNPVVNYFWEHGASGQADNGYGTKYEQSNYPWCFGNEVSSSPWQTLNICCWDAGGGYPDYRWCSTGSLDAGNQYMVVEAETVPDNVWKAGYDKVVAFEAGQGGGETGGTDVDVDLDPTKVLSPLEQKTQQEAAFDIINRFTGGTMDVEVILDLCRTTTDCGRYTYSATADKLTIHATGAVAACRGFYDYVKAKGAGICTWSGNRFVKPADMACDEVSLVTQFRDHQYFNVVTYGYTTPYWGKDRWRQELDWMAFHGIDMPLMLVGSEAIYRKVFIEDFGLTKEDVDEWEVGPAHLPWFRMGNLSGNTFDGPLGDEWNENQRQLAHYLLDEMKALGMKPICPAFGGFVPAKFSKTGSTPSTVGWDWCLPPSMKAGGRNVPNYRLMPNDPKFMEVGKAFMKRWEEEYGVGQFYLSDSFNEMAVPSASELPQYGQNIFSIIESSKNPNAVWVTQGWTFCYQSGSWGKTKFEALTKYVPNERFINLYMSPEYAEIYSTRRDFDSIYKGFSGKGWNYTLLPSMGGRSFWTGNLSKYAKGYLEDIYKMADRGNLVGYGMTPEGVENNELLYELICDAGWTLPGEVIDLDKWMQQYGTARYGTYTQEMQDLHAMLRKTVYNTYKDDRRFAWQCAGKGLTSGNGVGTSLNSTFYSGIEKLFSNADALKAIENPLLESELIEAAAMYVSGKIDLLTQEIKSKKSDKAECARLIGCLEDLMMDFDAALELHPTWNLKRWEDMAQSGYDKDAKRNAQNARRLITVWFGNHTSDEAVQDYACRIWGGLVRDYYCPRLIQQLQFDCGLIKSWNRFNFENDFVKAAPALSDPRPVNGDHIDFLVALINKAKDFGNAEAEAVEEIELSTDKESHWYVIRSAVDGKVLTTQGDNTELVTATDTKESEQIWRIVKTGDDLFRIESRFGQHVSTKGSAAKTYLPLLNADMKIAHPAGSESKTVFTIIPKAGHGAFYNNGLWTFEEASPALVVEAATSDYTRYIRRLAGFDQPELFGKVGQPKSEEALIAGIQALQKEANNIDHKTFATFLSQWDDVLRQTVTLSDDNDVNRLINLYMSAHQLIVPADALTDSKAETLLAAIKTAEKVVADGGDAVAAYTALNTAILAYYNAGGAITDTEVENLVPHSWVFPIGFDENADATRTGDRKLTFIALTEEGNDEQRFDLGYEKVYVNATDEAVFTCEPGATMTGTIGYAGTWMHGYLYIDFNGDGKLSYNVDKVEQDGTDCVSYSFWSGDLTQEDSGYNSAGQSLSGSSRNTVSNNKIVLPAFTAPSIAGIYNIRFKIDWNSVEPAGSTAQNIIANGGYIVDAVLQVGDVTAIAPITNGESQKCEIFDLQGRRINKLSKGVMIVNGRKVVR